MGEASLLFNTVKRRAFMDTSFLSLFKLSHSGALLHISNVLSLLSFTRHSELAVPPSAAALHETLFTLTVILSTSLKEKHYFHSFFFTGKLELFTEYCSSPIVRLDLVYERSFKTSPFLWNSFLIFGGKEQSTGLFVSWIMYPLHLLPFYVKKKKSYR